MSSDTIRVVIAEDHAIVREGVRMLLSAQPDIEVVDEAASGREVVAKAGQHRPDVVVMDITMPDMDGMEATRLLKSQHPDIEIVALTVHKSDEYFFQMLQAGASGYVLKGATSNDLVDAVRTAARGEVFLHPTVATRLLDDYLSRVEGGEVTDSYEGLTPREREVLIHIADGLTDREIAENLVISPSTVQTHRAHIMEKLGLDNRAALIKYAIRRGLVELKE